MGGGTRAVGVGRRGTGARAHSREQGRACGEASRERRSVPRGRAGD